MKPLTIGNRNSDICCRNIDGGILKRVRRRFDLALVVYIIALAIVLGALNNLRVANERKVKWFDSPTDRDKSEILEGAVP